MQRFDLLLFFLLTLLAEVLGTIGGFGSSIFFVPLGQFFFDFQVVLMLTGLLHVFSNTSKIYFFRKTIDWKIVGWLGVASLLFAIVGAYLTTFVDATYLRVMLGFFLIGFSLLFFFWPKASIPVSPRNSLISGSFAGFLAGFVGTGGAIRGLALASFNLEKNFFVGTSAMIDFGVDLSRTIIYAGHGFFSPELLWYIPLLAVAAMGGSYIGKRLLNKMKEEQFRKTMLTLIFLTGLILLLEQASPT